MASVAETLFADDGPRSGRKKKKRGDSRSSKHLDAVSALALGGSADGGGDARAVDAAWQQFTSPDGRTYYYNQITKESRWKLPKALRHKQQQEQNPQEAVAEPAPAAETHRARESATRSEATQRSAPERYGRKPEEQQSDDTHAKSAGRGDIVARLQASLAGRINPMASGPPPMVKIPRGIPEASDVGERTRANSTGTDAGGLFSASGVFGSEPAESQYDAETAGMTPAERLRFIRRKRQESMFKKEKIVEEDDFMKEFAMNMKKKEAERAQRMTPEELEREQRETERKKRELEEKKRREERERREQREAEEQAEREKLREREEEERRWREEKRKKKEEEEKQREAEELRLREELEREEKRRRKEERKRKEEEEAEKRRVEEEQEKSEIAKKAEDAEKASPTQDVYHKLQSRSRGSSAADVDNVYAAHYDLFHEGANEEENGSARTKRRSRSKGSKTFAADVVASNEARRSRSSSRQESNDFVQPPEEPVGSEIAPPRSRQASTASTEGAQIAAEHVAEQMEKVTIDEEDAEAEAEAERERRERKERRRRRKERERRRQEEESEDAQQHDTQPVPSPPTSGCQCAACVHHGNVPTSHHHHPPTSQHGQTPPGSYPYYPQHYPPPPFYAPPPTYGYPPPPPFMYAPPPPMMFPPAMIPPPMMATPMMGAPMSGNGMMFNGMPVGSSSAIIVAPEYAQYAPPVLSQCQSCRGRGVGLAEKNGFCAHCNRLRLDFIVASAQIRKRCTSCGGWGLGLVQANGMCAHCTRLASQATAPSTAIGSNIKSNPPPPVEWDASSSENDSDWDE